MADMTASHSAEVVPYDDQWPAQFEANRDELAQALDDQSLQFEHVGSTAVPGLAAKAVIDILLVLPAMPPTFEMRDILEGLGYYEVWGNADQATFSRLQPAGNLHMTSGGHPWAEAQIMFRNYLREHPDRRDGYAALKQQLAQQHAGDLAAYTKGKEAFIDETLALAKEATGPQPAPAEG